jgi:broad specificity phosphatase PhoE
MITLHLLRHGPTLASRSGAPLGRTDFPVSDEAQALWPRVKEELLALGVQRVLTSDLMRARDHALDLGLPCLVLPDLAEQSFGDWDGVPWSENKAAESFFANPVQTAPPGGESFARCASRALMAVQGALEGDVPTLILAHGGPLRAILAHFMGLPLDRALDLAWQNFGLTKLEVYGSNRGALRYHNRPLPTQGGMPA